MKIATRVESFIVSLAQTTAMLVITAVIAWMARSAIVNIREGDVFFGCWYAVLTAALGGRYVYNKITGV